MGCDVTTSHILNRFELAIQLTDASKRYSGASVELAVFNEDVGRVCFWRDCVVAIVYCPPAEGDVVCVDYVRPISILFSS